MKESNHGFIKTSLYLTGSLRLGATILASLIFALGAATVIESSRGSEQALARVYQSAWFTLLLAMLSLNMLAAVAVRWPLRRQHLGFVLTHASIVLILIGAWTTHHFGLDGQLIIAEGESRDTFVGQQEMLGVSYGGETVTAELESPIGGLEEVERPIMPELLHESLGARITVERYVPDSSVVERMTDDGAEAREAVQISFARGNSDETAWLVEGKPSHVGPASIAYRLADAEQMIGFSAGEDRRTWISEGLVSVTIDDIRTDILLADCLQSPVAIGSSGYRIKGVNVWTHASIGPDGKIGNISSLPTNPAVELTISGNGATESDVVDRRLVFSEYPEIDANLDDHHLENLRVTFTCPVVPKPETDVEIILGPDNMIFARFAWEGTPEEVVRLDFGLPVETPWPGRLLTLVRHFTHAKLNTETVPLERVRPDRVAALLVRVRKGEIDERIWVRRGHVTPVHLGGDTVRLVYTGQQQPFGFSVRLDHFRIDYYPGMQQPRSFRSQLTFTDRATGQREQRLVRMNHPTSYGGLTFFQSSYQMDHGATRSVLSVSRDPGMVITFSGYLGTFLGMVIVLVSRMREGRYAFPGHDLGDREHNVPSSEERTQPHSPTQQLSPTQPHSPTLQVRRSGDGCVSMKLRSMPALWLSLLVLMSLSVVTRATPIMPDTLDIEVIRSLPVQYDGRYMPLDTLARDVVQSVTGTQRFEDLDPVHVLLSWTFNADAWLDDPMIRINSDELRREIRLAESVESFSYRQLTAHRYLHSLVDEANRLEAGQKPDSLQKEVREIHRKLLLLHECFQGRTIPLIPDPNDALAAWQPIRMNQPARSEAVGRVQRAWQGLGAAFRADHAVDFSRESAVLVAALHQLPAAFQPDASLIATELRYNRLRPFHFAWIVLLGGSVLSLLSLHFRRRSVDLLSGIVLMSGFLLLTYGLVLRWTIAGRIPASNMFESLLFLSWGAGAFAIITIVVLRHRIVSVTAAMLSCIALLLGDCLPINQFISPIPPVLSDTVWMSIHVPIVMTSYSVLALAVLFAHAQLACFAVAPQKRTLHAMLDSLHYWYVHVGSILLFVGIVSGSIWAASSWGRYWGWDPKEVWSLVALLGYLTILHCRTGMHHGVRWSAAASIAVAVCVVVLVLVNLDHVSFNSVLGVAVACAALVFMVLGSGMLATALKSILAFWLIIMTYVGVNYVLGTGLHSYGFGSGAVVRRVLESAACDLFFVVLCCGIYLARKRNTVGYDRPPETGDWVVGDDLTVTG